MATKRNRKKLLKYKSQKKRIHRELAAAVAACKASPVKESGGGGSQEGEERRERRVGHRSGGGRGVGERTERRKQESRHYCASQKRERPKESPRRKWEKSLWNLLAVDGKFINKTWSPHRKQRKKDD